MARGEKKLTETAALLELRRRGKFITWLKDSPLNVVQLCSFDKNTDGLCSSQLAGKPQQYCRRATRYFN